MIHPSALFRNDSVVTRQFSAPISHKNHLDCGIKFLPCLTKCLRLEKLAKPSVFIICLSIISFLQGFILQYFRGTSKYWAQHYNISKDNVDWIVYTNEFFVGVFALLISYWGNRLHRAKWIGALTTYHAFASLLLIIPELHKGKDNNVSETSLNNLCLISSNDDKSMDDPYIAITILAFFQILASTAYISLLTHGITYLDDNILSHHSPTYIGIVLACKELGTQAGINAVDFFLNSNNIFVSPVWITSGCLTFLFGCLIAMFSRVLPNALIRDLAASLVDLASGQPNIPSPPKYDNFLKSFLRLITNKYLLINILAAVIIQSAVINFNIYESLYNQSRFLIAKREISVNFIRQPLVALSLLVTGLLLSRSKMKLRNLIIWNLIVTLLVIILFSSTAFLKCDQSSRNKYVKEQYRNCTCSKDFQPICLNEKIYYSPCVAGCTNKYENLTYSNCLSSPNNIAKEEGCDLNKCDLIWMMTQANRVFLTAVLASTLLTNIMINMRCIDSKDKALALGLEATFLGLVPYLPYRLVYGAVAEKTCLNTANNLCLYYSETFSFFVSLATICSFIVAFLLYILLLFINEPNVVRYKKDDEDDDEGSELRNIAQETQSPNQNHQSNENETNVQSADEDIVGLMQSNPDSLAEMENVGDDHDSINFDLASDNEDSNDKNKKKNKNVLESSF